MDSDLSCDFGLANAFAQQIDGFHPALLKRIEISSYSGWVSHTREHIVNGTECHYVMQHSIMSTPYPPIWIAGKLELPHYFVFNCGPHRSGPRRSFYAYPLRRLPRGPWRGGVAGEWDSAVPDQASTNSRKACLPPPIQGQP